MYKFTKIIFISVYAKIIAWHILQFISNLYGGIYFLSSPHFMYQINFTSCGFLSMIFSSCEKSGLLSEADWKSIQETLYLLSIPGIRESIKEGLATPIAECDGELEW